MNTQFWNNKLTRKWNRYKLTNRNSGLSTTPAASTLLQSKQRNKQENRRRGRCFYNQQRPQYPQWTTPMWPNGYAIWPQQFGPWVQQQQLFSNGGILGPRPQAMLTQPQQPCYKKVGTLLQLKTSPLVSVV